MQGRSDSMWFWTESSEGVRKPGILKERAKKVANQQGVWSAQWNNLRKPCVKQIRLSSLTPVGRVQFFQMCYPQELEGFSEMWEPKIHLAGETNPRSCTWLDLSRPHRKPSCGVTTPHPSEGCAEFTLLKITNQSAAGAADVVSKRGVEYT